MLIIILLLSTINAVDQKARVSYFNEIGESRVEEFKYFLKSELIRYGESFALNIYKVGIEECVPFLVEGIEDFFAAYAIVPAHCDVDELISEIQNHGADFIFLDVSAIQDLESVKKNNFKIPIVFMDNLQVDFFKFDKDVKRRFINIFFELSSVKNSSQKNYVKLDFYYVPSYKYSAKFLSTIKTVVSKLQDKIVFEPHLITFSSESEQFISNNCVSNGLYCEFDPDNFNNISGRMVILEAIRQKCIFKIDIFFYFDYMLKFYELCEDTFSDDCSKNLILNLNQSYEPVSNCLLKSFQSSSFSNINYNDNNSLLELEKNKQKSLSVTTFPNIYINDNLYSGSLSDMDLLLSICSSLDDETQNCHNLDLEVVRDVRKLPIFLLFGVLFLICFIILVVICKRIARQRYLKELNIAVNQYISEYSKIEESKLNITVNSNLDKSGRDEDDKNENVEIKV